MRNWRQAVPLAAVGAALAVGVAGCGASKKPATTTTAVRPVPPVRASSIRSAPLPSLFEDQGQLFSNPAGTLDTLRKLGVTAVRIYLSWASVAPDAQSARQPRGFHAASPAGYRAAGWQPYDAIIRAAAARGIGVMLTPEGPPPRWAAGPGAPAGTPDGGADWKPSAAAFGSFVRAVATRYSGSYAPPGSSHLPRVTQWSIWNEPNYGPQLAPQATDNSRVEVSPVIYRGLLNAAWTALHATGHGSDTILIGELAPRGITGAGYPGNFSGMVPLRFLRALYCVDGSLTKLQGAAATARGCPATPTASQSFAQDNPALFQATGIALHPYAEGALAPNFVTPGEPDYADLATLPKVESTLDRMFAAYRVHTRLPIYDTEFGYKTNPPYKLGASLDKAALYENWAEYISWRDPRVRSWDQYLLVDPPAASQSRFVTGLEFANGTPKPVFGAWRMPIYLPQTSGPHGLPVEIWGCARPVLYATGASAGQVQIQFRAGTSAPFETVKTVTVTPDDCYFDVPLRFASSGTVRASWTYPHGGTIYSRQVVIDLT